MKNSAPQTSAISMVWPKSGCSTSSVTTSQQQRQRHGVGRHFRPPRRFGEQPGDQDDEGRLEEFRRLDVDAEQITSQRRAPLISAPKNGVAATSTRLTTNTTSASAADLPRRQERRRRAGPAIAGQQEQDVPVDEMERVEAEPRRDRRARRERQDDAGQHQRDRAPPASARSTVHHQSPKGVRCVREIMDCSPYRLLVLTRHGFQDVNAWPACRYLTGLTPRQRQHQLAEAVAAHLEIPDTGRTRRRPATAAPPAP